MSHWINETTVKSELRSPGLESSVVSGGALAPSSTGIATHLDSPFGLCATAATIDPLQSSTPYVDTKQEYYYNYSMQQYTPSFYSSYSTPYSSRTSSKIPSPNTYLTSSYAAATNNNSAQLYPSYAGYANNFSQFSSHPTQQDYTGYYNDQYSYYGSAAAAGYSPYVGSPSSSGSQSFHAPVGLPESPSDLHSTTPTLLTVHSHSPHSPLSISPNTNVSAKSTPSKSGGSGGGGRTRGRRHAHPSPTRSNASDTAANPETVKPPERVFIWDLDETIIIFHSLITGAYSNKYGKVRETARGQSHEMIEFLFYRIHPKLWD